VQDEQHTGIAAPGEAKRSYEADDIHRRGDAWDMFVSNPQHAAKEFPDLVRDVSTFLRSSSNPYANANDGSTAREGSELQFDEWNRAQQWAIGHDKK